jgi:hypothetical protein
MQKLDLAGTLGVKVLKRRPVKKSVGFAFVTQSGRMLMTYQFNDIAEEWAGVGLVNKGGEKPELSDEDVDVFSHHEDMLPFEV